MLQIVILKVILLFALIVGCYQLLKLAGQHRVLMTSVRYIRDKTQEQSKERSKREIQLHREEGKQEKESLFYRLDAILLQSGIRRNFPFLNPELFITIVTGCIVLGAITAGVITGTWFWGCVAAVGIFGSIYFILYLLLGSNYRKTEEGIMTFLNLVENFNTTDDDLINIFGKVAPYLQEPLKSTVRECYQEAVYTGDTEQALQNLEAKIEHEKFKEIIRNLSVCSRYEANYGEIVKDSRQLLREHLAMREERKAIRNNARAEIAILILGCGLVLYMLNGFLSVPMITQLTGSFVGQMLLLYLAVILVIGGISLWKVDKS